MEVERVRQQTIADLASPEADALVELFFDVTFGERQLVVDELFLPHASYRSGGKVEIIADTLEDDGSLGTPQWWEITKFRLVDSLAVAAFVRTEPLGRQEVVVKFSFKRNAAGALRIASIEEVEL